MSQESAQLERTRIGPSHTHMTSTDNDNSDHAHRFFSRSIDSTANTAGAPSYLYDSRLVSSRDEKSVTGVSVRAEDQLRSHWPTRARCQPRDLRPALTLSSSQPRLAGRGCYTSVQVRHVVLPCLSQHLVLTPPDLPHTPIPAPLHRPAPRSINLLAAWLSARHGTPPRSYRSLTLATAIASPDLPRSTAHSSSRFLRHWVPLSSAVSHPGDVASPLSPCRARLLVPLTTATILTTATRPICRHASGRLRHTTAISFTTPPDHPHLQAALSRASAASGAKPLSNRRRPYPGNARALSTPLPTFMRRPLQ